SLGQGRASPIWGDARPAYSARSPVLAGAQPLPYNAQLPGMGFSPGLQSMSIAPVLNVPIQGALAAALVERSMSVLAETTGATVVVFDASGEVAFGPISGVPVVQLLLRSAQGREAVIAAHRQAVGSQFASPDSRIHPLLDDLFERFGVSVTTTGRCAGTLTLGDRPKSPLTTQQVSELAAAFGVRPAALQDAASQLEPWTPDEAKTARDLAALLADLFAEICTQEKHLRHRIEELSAVYNIASLF